ncbi:MAG: hypothetical protein ABI351_05185 [Herbaspirillum sp.]
MTHIPFEKISLQDAKAVLDGDQPMRDAVDWDRLRRSKSNESIKLTDFTVRWLFQQSKEHLPKMLAREYPRIVNQIADLWERPDTCIRYLDDLLIDQRGTRQGFPLRIVQELTRMRTFLVGSEERALTLTDHPEPREQ